MWFRNLIIYRLPADWALGAPQLEDALARRPLQPCSAFEMQSRGWVAPAPGGRLLHVVNQQLMFALGVDQKLLPGSIIRQVAAERAAAQAEDQGFPVGRRQMRDIRMRVTEELRARALTRRRTTRAWIDPQNGWLIIDAAGAARAEELVETLRDTLGGSLAVQFMDTERSPQQAMSAWLTHGDAPLRFSIDQDLELQSVDGNKAMVRYTRHALDPREIQAHLKAGKFPLKLGLTWNDRISFMLTEKLHVKRVEFLEMKKDAADESDLDEADQFDIDFTVMAGELARLLEDLGTALGGQPQRQAA